MIIENFERVEKKYLLTKSEYEKILSDLSEYIKPDIHPDSKICNIYFDTDKDDMIISSLEKPKYKEKVRLRSYIVPDMDSQVFLEIKKKYKGVVGKRRIAFKLSDFYKYMKGEKNLDVNKQILNEIDYTIKTKNLKPKIFIAYDRKSYDALNEPDLRITFDYKIRSRRDDLRLEMGDAGSLYFKDDMYIMEIKTLNNYPLWLTRILSKNNIYETSFSKYGKIYANEQIKEEKVYV